MNLQESAGQLMALQDKLSAYEHALSMINYDGDTTAPSGTAANRAHAMGILMEEVYKLSTCDETVALLEDLDAHKDELTEKQQRMVHLMLKDLREMQKIPMDEYVGFETLLVEAGDVWHKAKEESDFAMFEPYLQKIFDTQKKFAGYCSPGTDPYDYLLDKFEEGLTKESCDRFFAALKERIVPLVKAIGSRPQVDDSILKGDFTDTVQEAFAYWLMGAIGLDLDHVGLGTTEHPFTTSIGSHYDVRITTKYDPDRFDYSMFSVIHEGGHAMYDSHSADDLAYTVLDGGMYMSIHESQSRFYENIIGRSRAFAGYVFPKLQELFPENTRKRTAEDFYRAVNRVEPSLIRTEADEVTYSLHVMIRYELEKAVMAGELTVHELPEAWNRLYKEYLGVDVPDDRRGVLQDSHWSGGAIGYFPSYALGSAYGAQFLRKMKETVDVDACVAEGDFAPVNSWLEERVWQYGGLYTPEQLLDRILGEPFDPMVYVDYLEQKYKEVYGL